MTKESGPREKALREMREARITANELRNKQINTNDMLAGLRKAVTTAAKKTGKPRKGKK